MNDPGPVELNADDSATASDHLPVQVVFNNPFMQPFSISSIVRSNETVTLKWNSVPGQSYAVEYAAEAMSTGVWNTVATSFPSTNFICGAELHIPSNMAVLRVRRQD